MWIMWWCDLCDKCGLCELCDSVAASHCTLYNDEDIIGAIKWNETTHRYIYWVLKFIAKNMLQTASDSLKIF